MNAVRIVLLFIAILLYSSGLSQNRYMLEEWRNPKIYGVNKEPPHIKCAPINEKNPNLPSPWIKKINGKWKFNFSRNPNEKPNTFYQERYSTVNWKEIDVPGSWQMQGYDFPIYVYNRYPFPNNPPNIPNSYNPIGSYLKQFDIPASWKNRQVFICLQGVSSAFYLWVNGQYVGYSEDGKLPADFDITAHVQRGINTLALQVFRWSDGAYFEKFDSWNMSGIERDVVIYSTPKLHVRDYFFTTKWNEDYSKAKFQAEVEVVNYHTKSCSPHEFVLGVFDEKNKKVGEFETIVEDIGGGELVALKFDIDLSDIKKWSAETPNLYSIKLGLKDKGTWIERQATKFGFRDVKIEKGKLLVNGKPINLMGVNRIEFSSKTGGYVSEKEMVKEILLMKQHNINAVRTNGFPADMKWYDLCDKYGLYVIDEANINIIVSRGKNSKSLVLNKDWEPVFIDRVSRMVERDKNHPSVIMWSLGTESDDGDNFISAYNWIKQRDESRPIFYDNATENYYMVNHSDVDVWPTPAFDQLKLFDKVLRKKPLLIGRMGRMNGNSSGNLKEYIKWVKKENQIQGGFIDKWKDKAIKKKNVTGEEFWAYGGEFGPSNVPSDGRKCLNGIVGPECEITPELIEVKKLFQKIDFQWANKADYKIRLKSNNRFENMDDYYLFWELKEDGKVLQKDSIGTLNLEPMSSSIVKLNIDSFNVEKGAEYWLDVQIALKKKKLWAEQGHSIAHEQLSLNVVTEERLITKLPGRIKIKQTGDEINLRGKNFELLFQNGRLHNYSFEGVKMLADGGGPMVNAYRAPVENEYRLGQEWKFLRLERLMRRAISTKIVSKTKEMVNVETINEYDGNDGVGFKHTCLFTVCSNGFVRVENTITPKGTLPELGKLGVFLTLPEGFKSINWYGRGPHENYPDRKESAFIGEYELEVDNFLGQYIHPQDYASRQDVRWVAALNEKKQGLLFKLMKPSSFKATNYRGWMLDHANHINELPRVEKVYMELNVAERGVGDYSTGVLDAYKVSNKEVNYSFIMRPVTTDSGSLREQGREVPPKM
ncbi:DUF4981 domain-containing protein [Prolixibacteraceae bacterium JC049]|nr:DUF4981 domain-containing protein [Prolixibacteraceae bacterium JC049]